jgi:ribulose-5-phosphate 4-epimerase/fuculose-1-phosphate aldolase
MSSIYHSVVRPVKELPMTEAERKARVELAACYRIFDMLGWTQIIFNHITVKIPGPKPAFLINPFGLAYHEVTASNLVLIDVNGNTLRESKWPVNQAGYVIHSALHGSNPDVNCVMHTHTTTGMAVACL